MKGTTTYIQDPSAPKEDPKEFNFDFSYWSHDGFKEEADGNLVPTDKKYADQVSIRFTIMFEAGKARWRGGILQESFYLDVPARLWNFDFLYTYFNPHLTPVNIPRWYRKHTCPNWVLFMILFS